MQKLVDYFGTDGLMATSLYGSGLIKEASSSSTSSSSSSSSSGTDTDDIYTDTEDTKENKLIKEASKTEYHATISKSELAVKGRK